MMALRFTITCPTCGGPLEPIGKPSVARSGRASDTFTRCAPCDLTHHVAVTLTTCDAEEG